MSSQRRPLPWQRYVADLGAAPAVYVECTVKWFDR